MPAEFLSDEQRVAYGAFGEVPSLSDLDKFFFLAPIIEPSPMTTASPTPRVAAAAVPDRSWSTAAPWADPLSAGCGLEELDDVAGRVQEQDL
jgi:hypothetical protein